jgi:hypothetical protein
VACMSNFGVLMPLIILLTIEWRGFIVVTTLISALAPLLKHAEKNKRSRVVLNLKGDMLVQPFYNCYVITL